MSKIKSTHVFTSESVSEGHPDKVCDQISDSVVDACLEQDPNSRVACECLVTTDLVVLSGEITTNAQFSYEQLARNVIAEIGYNSPEIGFSADACKVMLCIHRQSADISLGVTAATNTEKEQGAGDQGMMFGYASDDTEELMPAPIIFSHKIVQRLAELRHTQPKKYPFLRPDAKSQVSVLYEKGEPVRVETVVVSHQHTPEMKDRQLRGVVEQVVKEVIPARFLHKGIQYYVNPTGRFVIGGPAGDTGLTGRKIIVDTYGGVGCHGGGAFSGKDPSKVDRSAAYMSRYLAKNVVADGLAKKCEVQVAYAIGVPRPLSINVDTFGTGVVADAKLQTVIQTSNIFDFRPAQIIATLGLKTPHRKGWTYRETAAYGHFGKSQFPWEKLDKVAALKKAVR